MDKRQKMRDDETKVIKFWTWRSEWPLMFVERYPVIITRNGWRLIPFYPLFFHQSMDGVSSRYDECGQKKLTENGMNPKTWWIPGTGANFRGVVGIIELGVGALVKEVGFVVLVNESAWVEDVDVEGMMVVRDFRPEILAKCRNLHVVMLCMECTPRSALPLTCTLAWWWSKWWWNILGISHRLCRSPKTKRDSNLSRRV